MSTLLSSETVANCSSLSLILSIVLSILRLKPLSKSSVDSVLFGVVFNLSSAKSSLNSLILFCISISLSLVIRRLLLSRIKPGSPITLPSISISIFPEIRPKLSISIRTLPFSLLENTKEPIVESTNSRFLLFISIVI